MNTRPQPTPTSSRPSPPVPPIEQEGDEPSTSSGAPSHPPSRPPLFPIIAGVVLLVGAGVLSYSLLGAGGTSATGGRPKGSADKGLPLVSIDVAKVAPFSVSQRVAGVVTAANQATLRARAGGQVAALPATLGAHVEKGALLVALDAGTLSAELERARAAAQAAAARVDRANVVLDDAAAELERRIRLVSQGASASRTKREATTAKALAVTDVALAKAEVRRANAEVEIIRVRLEQTRTRAPFAGQLAALDLDVGETVTAGRELVTVVAKGAPRVNFGLSESAARSLTVGDKLQVWTDDGEATATVERIGASISNADRVRSIEAVFETELEGTLLVGGFAEVEIRATAPAGTPLVSMLALRGRGTNRKALVLNDDNTVTFTDVQILVEDGKVAAVAGLTVGDRVVRAGGPRLKDGDKVEVIK